MKQEIEASVPLPVPSVPSPETTGQRYATPPLIAQLLAARLDLPQARRRRRVAPAVATLAYAATQDTATEEHATHFSRLA